jgi:hypothetical protein
MVLSGKVTHKGKTSTLCDLLMANKIFAFIQHSKQGGCKILCQHNDPTIICLKTKAAATHPQEWFSTNIVGMGTTDTLDWSTKNSNPGGPTRKELTLQNQLIYKNVKHTGKELVSQLEDAERQQIGNIQTVHHRRQHQDNSVTTNNATTRKQIS